jgi:hypothetical protein
LFISFVLQYLVHSLMKTLMICTKLVNLVVKRRIQSRRHIVGGAGKGSSGRSGNARVGRTMNATHSSDATQDVVVSIATKVAAAGMAIFNCRMVKKT